MSLVYVVEKRYFLASASALYGLVFIWLIVDSSTLNSQGLVEFYFLFCSLPPVVVFPWVQRLYKNRDAGPVGKAHQDNNKSK